MEKPAKKRILIAAEKLFVTQGYKNVSVREIAKEATCSHTSIYLYYKDKKGLLAALAAPYLVQLLAEQKQLSSVRQSAVHYVQFGLVHRRLYELYITSSASRVDQETADVLDQLRLQLFEQLRTVVSNEASETANTLLLARILFFQLHGTIMTYVNSDENLDELQARVLPIVEAAVEKIMRGE